MGRLFFVLCLAATLSAQSRQVAITFDDLPRGGDLGPRELAPLRQMTLQLLDSLKGIPVTGFVNANKLDAAAMRQILKIWQQHGADLGNHTYSHANLNQIPFEAYADDILQGEPAIIEALGGHRPVYFRHPYLFTGKNLETKQRLEKFLAEHGYKIAPVTLDNADYMFALVYQSARQDDPALSQRARDAFIPYMESVVSFFESRSKEVVGREFPQILLLHANQLNADSMTDLLQMMRRRGYQFISLTEALRDPAYRQPDEYVGTGGFSWIHRWSQTKGMPPKGEPDEPSWISEEFRRRQ